MYELQVYCIFDNTKKKIELCIEKCIDPNCLQVCKSSCSINGVPKQYYCVQASQCTRMSSDIKTCSIWGMNSLLSFFIS